MPRNCFVPAEFVSLADVLRPRAAAKCSDVAEADVAPAIDEAAPREVTSEDGLHAEALRDARRFRAVLADALESALASLLREFACDVLARELLAAPCAMDALVARLVREHIGAGPLRVRVSPDDQLTTCDFPVVRDAALQPGDAILECTSGSIDARLGVRLADILDRASDAR